MQTKVKICGMRSLEMAQVSIDSRADFLGFNFVPDSKRYITVEKAKDIIEQLKIENYELRNKLVGVFRDQPLQEVNAIAEFLNLDFVQLHGEEDMDYISDISKKVIKKIVIPTEEERRVEGSDTTELIEDTKLNFQVSGVRFLGYARNDKVEYFLLDRTIQGQGEMVDLKKAKEIAEQFPIFFAGGLTPENVTEIIQKVKPFGVDVAGGIETNGLPDLGKIKMFIANAKGVTQ